MLLKKKKHLIYVDKNLKRKLYKNIVIAKDQLQEEHICVLKEKHVKNIILKKKQLDFKISKLVFEYKKENMLLLYNSLNLKTLAGDGVFVKFYNNLKKLKKFNVNDFKNDFDLQKRQTEHFFDVLIRNEFIIPIKQDDYQALKGAQNTFMPNNAHISILYLLNTNNCNLRCEYCSVINPKKKPAGFKYGLMSDKTAKAGIDLFSKIITEKTKEGKIIFYGGEPLLNWDNIHFSLRYINKLISKKAFKEKKVDAQIVTNGTMIDAEKARIFKKYNVSAGVSIDGDKPAHSPARPYADKRSSWEDTIRGLNFLKKAGAGFGVSCTLGKHNYKDMEKIAEYFATELEISGLGINLIKALPSGNKYDIDYETATKSLIKAYEKFSRLGIYEDRLMRKVKSFVEEEQHFYDCAGYGGQIAVTPDGFVGTCHILAEEGRYLFGHIADKDIENKIIKSQLMKDWCGRTPICMKKCQGCIGLGICGGGCALEPISKGGGLYDMDEKFCAHCKTTINWLFDETIKLIKSA